MPHRNRLSYVLVALVLVTALLLGAFPASAFATPSGIPVLILQDADPWGCSSYRTVLLPSLGYAPRVATWSDLGVSVDLAGFRDIYVANDQTQSFYDGYGTHAAALTAWVQAGGNLIFSVCSGWNPATIGTPLPGGAVREDYSSLSNTVVDPTHPVVTGELSDGVPLSSPFYGNNASNSHFTVLPAGARVIFRDDSGNPTLAEYRLGSGLVLASSVDWEWAYEYGETLGIRSCDDLFLYAFPKVTHTITATATTGGTVTPSGSITVAEGSSSTFAIAADKGFHIASVLLDGKSVTVSDPATMAVTVSDVLSDRRLAVSFAACDASAPTISLSRLRTSSEVSNWVDGTVPSFTVGFSPFSLSFDLSDNSGTAKWSIVVNNRVIVDPWGSGTVTYPVPLTSGRNDVLISAVDASGNSAAQKLLITLDGSGPVLTLDPALPASVTSSNLVVAGTVADAISGIRSLSINGAPVAFYSDGSFREQVTLTKGDNVITIDAKDGSGNVTSQTFTVKYGAASSSASSSLDVVLTVGQKSMQVNGMPVAMDAAPVMQSGRTLLPIRALIHTLGGTAAWNATSKTATIALGGRTVSVTIGSKTALVDSKPATLDVAPVIINGRTFLPLRFIGENLGLDLAWDAPSQTISFTYWP